MSGRNWIMRPAAAEAIRHDPDRKNGNYDKNPTHYASQRAPRPEAIGLPARRFALLWAYAPYCDQVSVLITPYCNPITSVKTSIQRKTAVDMHVPAARFFENARRR